MGIFFANLVRTRWTPFLSTVVIALAWFMPPGGFGIPLCFFRTFTDLPCPGCGLTRSFIRMAHGDLAAAFFYHPLGVAVFPLLVISTLLWWVGPARREELAQAMLRHTVAWTAFAILLAIVFVANGVGRIWWIMNSGRPSPW